MPFHYTVGLLLLDCDDRELTDYLVYTPPNAADYGYNIFDEATGRASYVSQAHSVSKAQGKE